MVLLYLVDISYKYCCF